ncbi:MAG: hypothetical protein A2W23_01180 [Planctomycetes bacterium RBG_16_43_13]|nr:MAG: hypothetical protein A2W23_01180 [Planctomycetes bacterium RBG_16_43_13]
MCLQAYDPLGEVITTSPHTPADVPLDIVTSWQLCQYILPIAFFLLLKWDNIPIVVICQLFCRNSLMMGKTSCLFQKAVLL